MESQATQIALTFLGQVAIIITSGVVFSRISRIIHMPDVVFFVLAGIIMGPEIMNIIHLENPALNQVILTFGAAYILYDGGREINLRVINQVKLSVALLATLGVLISTFLTALFAMKLLHLDFIFALLLGVTIASTDPSVLVPLFKKMNLSNKLKQTIIAESACNDAVAAIAVFAILGVIAGGTFSLIGSIGEVLGTAGGGILIGLIVGLVALFLVSNKRYGFLTEYIAEIAVAAVAGAYVLASMLGFSGFMAVFVFGVISGNKKSFRVDVHEHVLRAHMEFKDVLISIMRMMIFVLLGSQMNFSILLKYGWGALGVVILLIFVARSVSVIFSVLPDRRAKWTFREILYLMWVRETGVIPAALAGMLVTMKVPNAQIISSVTCMAIIITLTFQASTSSYLAKLLGLQKGEVSE